jgi:putative nucleotidyltransferase with HDIG domain
MSTDKELVELQLKLDSCSNGKDWLSLSFNFVNISISRNILGDNTIKIAKKAIEVAKKIANYQDIVISLMNLATILYISGDIGGAFEYLFQAKFFINDDVELLHQRKFYNFMGVIYHLSGNIVFSLENYEKALFICKKIEDFQKEAITLSNIGLLHQQQGDIEIAENLFFEAESIHKKISNKLGCHKVWLNILGLYQVKLKPLELNSTEYTKIISDALKLLEEGLGETELRNNPALFSPFLNLSARFNLLSSNTPLAWEHALEALKLSEQLGSVDLKSHSYITLSMLEQAEHRPEKVLEYLCQALEGFTQLGYKDNMLEAHTLLAQSYKGLGKFEQALHHTEEHHRIDREVMSEAALKQLELMGSQRKLEQAKHQTELEQIRNEELEEKVRERTLQLEGAYLEMLERLAVAAEFRDTDTGEHTIRVGNAAATLAELLGMNEMDCYLMRLAARLHDVGKIAVSDTILHKPGKLTFEEYEIIKTHTTAGAKMLEKANSSLLQMAEIIALTHHERWDGTGYPNGLKGEEIPLEGRIVAVVDVLDALTSERPYKRAWTLEEALEEIKNQSGRHFDPRVVEVLITSYEGVVQKAL